MLELLRGPIRERFRELVQFQLEALCAELGEIVRKHDHQSRERMGREGDAWKRALRRFYGPRYGSEHGQR